jgi:short-subunit dehydrogenase
MITKKFRCLHASSLTLGVSGFSVTCLMPGATDTEFFARAEREDARIGQAKKDDPDAVARIGFDAMMRGEGDVVSGWSNKLKTALSAQPGAARG